MDDNCNIWVLLVGVVIRRWVWLQCSWLVGGVVRRYNIIDFLILLIPTPCTCMSSFLAAASLLLCSFLKCFFVSVCVIFVQYSKHSRLFKNRDHADMAI